MIMDAKPYIPTGPLPSFLRLARNEEEAATVGIRSAWASRGDELPEVFEIQDSSDFQSVEESLSQQDVHIPQNSESGD